MPCRDFQTDFGILQPGYPGFEFYRNELESGNLTDTHFIERLFGRRGVDEFTQQQRDIEDTDTDALRALADINQKTLKETEDLNASIATLTSTLQASENPLTQSLQNIVNPENALIASLDTLSNAFATEQTQSVLQATEALTLALTPLSTAENPFLERFDGIVSRLENVEVKVQQTRTVHSNLVTPAFANAVSDQQNINVQLGKNIR